MQAASLRDSLLTWYAQHRRDLPWRRTRDPYAIWLSETMLQQTRVSAVIPYYEKFLALFPTPGELAEAPESDVLAAWSGLGYYYRARNLQKAARQIVELGGIPKTYEALRSLPGIGDYTAAAVASIAFGLPHAVVDGNVLRVLSRLFADGADIASLAGRKHFTQVANDLLEPADPSSFNQAMMELGATICLPKNPQCLLCPLARLCGARATGRQSDFPIKRNRPKSMDEERTVYWIERDGSVLAWQRPPHFRLMPGFWELPEPEHLTPAGSTQELGAFRHAITTHNYRFRLLYAQAPADLGVCDWVNLDSLGARPVSTVFRKALRLVHNQAKSAAAAKVN